MELEKALQIIRERISLVDLVGRYVELKRNGARYTAPCPFHQETRPSFSVNADKGFFYCFGCQASGDLIEFYSRINGTDFRETVEHLAQEAGIVVEFGRGNATDQARKKEEKSAQRQMLQMHELAAEAYMANLERKESAACREYLDKRNVSREIRIRFGLGWAPADWHFLERQFKLRGLDLQTACEAGLLSSSEKGNVFDRFRGRLMFPIKNLSGQTIAFGGRIIEDADEAKYINSAESAIYRKKEHLYGLFQARRNISAQGSVYLTEGYMDVLTLHQYGFGNSVGVLGTALTDEQIKRLSGFCSHFVFIFDGDKPGQKAALRACEMTLTKGLKCQVVILPAEHDIDSLLKTEGPEAFEALRSKAPDGLAFCINAVRNLAPKDAVEWTKNFLANIKVPELCLHYASALASGLNLDETSLREHAAAPKSRKVTPAPARKAAHNTRDSQILIFAVRYPDRLADLRNIGADMALVSSRAREFLQLIETWGSQEILSHLTEEQKEFWLAHRGPFSAPLTTGDLELACLEKELDAYYAASKKTSLSRALAQNGQSADFNEQLAYLRALQETLGNRNEQS